MEFVFQDTVLHFFRLPHEGKAYAQVPHYGLLLSQNRFRILIAGDCEVASPALRDTLAGQAVNLAILDFPWLTLPQGRAFVREVIRPEHLPRRRLLRIPKGRGMGCREIAGGP